MSTNYYIEKMGGSEHVGKAISNGLGKGQTFIWAMKKKKVLKLCAQNMDTPFIVGDGPVTGRQFINMVIEDFTDDDYSLVGTFFL